MEMTCLATKGDHSPTTREEQDGSDSADAAVSFRMYEVIKFELISLVVNAMNT